MKFSVSSSALLKQLQKASGAIGSNPVLPVLEDFLFVLNSNILTISASDLEISIIIRMEVHGEENGSVAIPAKILTDTLKAMPEQPVTIQVDDENYATEITSSFGKYRMAGDNPDDFPQVPVKEDNDSVQIESGLVVKAINHSLFATSNDELRPAMMGVYVQVDFNKITFVATDAHKLVKYTQFKLKSNVSASFIVPKKAFSLLKSILPEQTEIDLSFNRTNAFFNFDQTFMACRLVDAKYPDYNAVIPTNNENLLTVGRTDLLNSLRRIVIYSNKTTNQVILKINDSSLNISAQDLDFSNEATEQMPCLYQGDPIIIAFNAKFLIDMLSVINSSEVLIKLSSPAKAGLLMPSVQAENEDITMLIMPVMLNQ